MPDRSSKVPASRGDLAALVHPDGRVEIGVVAKASPDGTVLRLWVARRRDRPRVAVRTTALPAGTRLLLVPAASVPVMAVLDLYADRAPDRSTPHAVPAFPSLEAARAVIRSLVGERRRAATAELEHLPHMGSM